MIVKNDGSVQFNGDEVRGKSVNGERTLLNYWGGIRFTWDSDTYGNNDHHSIRSTYGNSWGDDLTINSFHHLRVNLDANNNNTDARFEIGHNTTGTENLLFVVREDGNVGIGTGTSPSYALDVVGDVNVTGNFKVNGTNLSTGSSGTLSYAQLGSVTVPYSTSTTSMTISPSNGLSSIVAIEVQVFSNASPATWTGPLTALSANSTYKAGIWGGSTQYANFYRNSAGTSITFSGAPSANIYNATVYEIKVV